MNNNFWRGEKIRLRPLEQQDLDEILTSTEEPDTEIDRNEDVIGFPLSKVKQRKEVEAFVE